MAYVVGALEKGEQFDRLRPLAGDTASGSHAAIYFILEKQVTDANEDDLAEGEAAEAQNALDDDDWPAWSLCLSCGVVVEGHRPPPAATTTGSRCGAPPSAMTSQSA